MDTIIINGKYKRVKRLGSGGQGKVYLVEDKDFNKYIAKTLEKKQNKDKFEYFENEEITKRKIEMF